MQLDDILKYGKRSDVYKGVKYDFIKLPYWMVKVEIADALQQGDIFGAVEVVVGEEVEQTKESAAFALWIFDSYKQILEMEEVALTSKPDQKLIDAGIERLNIFGELNVINTLAKGDILKYEEVKKLSYEDVFNKLLMDKIESEINKDYADSIIYK